MKSVQYWTDFFIHIVHCIINTMRQLLAIFLFWVATIMVLGCSGNDTPPSGDNNLIDVHQINLANDSLLREAKKMIQTGDLVLRKGNDFSSDQVRSMSKEDKTYSHAGIALVKGDSVLVYHVEPDFYYINDKVRKENIDSFFNRAHNTEFAVARFKLDSIETKVLLNYLEDRYQEKVAFDMGFDLKSDDKMYCSEMIKKGLAKATNNRITIEVQRMNDKSKYKIIKQYFKLQEKQFVNREIIPIDRLYLNPSCTIIKRFTYQQ